MTLTQVQAFYGLRAIATPTGTNISNDVQIGIGNTVSSLSGINIAYSFRAIVPNSQTLIVETETGICSQDGGTGVAGTAQVETATAAGTITGSGNATVVVTAAGMTGSPKTISVAVTNGDTASTWAEKVRVALTSDSAVSALFTVSGSTTSIVLTRKPTSTFNILNGSGDTIDTFEIYPANDATLNISLDNGTCTGITTASTSANTTAGVATTQVYLAGGLGDDFEGVALPTMTDLRAVLIEVDNTAAIGDLEILHTGTTYFPGSFLPGDIKLSLFRDGLIPTNMEFTADGGPAGLTFTIFGTI